MQTIKNTNRLYCKSLFLSTFPSFFSLLNYNTANKSLAHYLYYSTISSFKFAIQLQPKNSRHAYALSTVNFHVFLSNLRFVLQTVSLFSSLHSCFQQFVRRELQSLSIDHKLSNFWLVFSFHPPTH
jgi:hypothetical protein